MTSQRLQYIDALRGIAVMLIVFSHIALYSYGDYGGAESFRPLTTTIQLPLLFFVSGFVFTSRPLLGGG